MFRYGQADFDADYRRWGFHDPATQAQEAESVLRLLPGGRPLRILDLACGLGRHAVRWAQAGHQVTGVDLSETFLAEARAATKAGGVAVAFVTGDIRRLPYHAEFDAAVWIERSFFDVEVARTIAGCLVEGGLFITDERNPGHARMRQRNADWRTWREEDGRFLLESHETDSAGVRHDRWIEIDPAGGKVVEKESATPVLTQADRLDMLRQAGCGQPSLHTMAGEPFGGGPEPYWLWLAARKTTRT